MHIKIIILAVLLLGVKRYAVSTVEGCAGIEEVRKYFHPTAGTDVFCAVRADNTTSLVVVVPNADIVIPNDDIETSNHDIVIEHNSNNSYIYFINTPTNMRYIKRLGNFNTHSHIKWVQDWIEFIYEVGSLVVRWISLPSKIIKCSMTRHRTITTWYEHGLYFDITTADSITPQVSALEQALDNFFNSHKNVCYSYCLGIDYRGDWHAYIKMNRENHENTSFKCTSANHITNSCSFKGENGELVF